MENTKNLNYYKCNAEEDYITTPISVLRYITELEQVLQLLQTDVIKSVCVHCNEPKEVKRIDGSYWCKDCRKGW